MNIKYNNELKTIDTPEKAYLLGQIYGDATNQCRTGRYKMSLASIDTDTPLYIELSKIFPFLQIKKYSSQPNLIYLENHQKALCHDLKDLGMLSNKSKKDATGEFHFPTLRKDLEHHFIRGYFDADGSAWFPNRKRSRNNLQIEFGCATPNFLRKIYEILSENGINFVWTERYKKAGNGKYYYSYKIFSSNRENSLKFADYIYKDATLYLTRKKEICYKTPSYRPSAFELFGKCPYCGGNSITKDGSRRNPSGVVMQRLECGECNRRFSRPMPTSEVTQNE